MIRHKKKLCHNLFVFCNTNLTGATIFMITKYTCKPSVHNNFQNCYKPIGNLSVIRQKGESRKEGNKKTSTPNFQEKRTFFTP